MIKILKKLLLWIVPLALSICCTFADIPDSLSVTMAEKMTISEAIDFTVTAIKDWEHLKEYTWTVYFEIYDANWNPLTDHDLYTLPANEWYDFVDTDQWKKTFSKWLWIKKAWTYTVFARDLFNDSVVWKAVVEVSWGEWPTSIEIITISYPSDWSTETKPYVVVMWSCENLKNSPVVLYLNWNAVSSGFTAADWKFEIQVAELVSWDNSIQAKIIDVNWVILWESSVIYVKYQVSEANDFNLEILPSRTWVQWDKIVLNLNTADSISSAQLLFSNWLKYSMDRIWQWLFSKELVTTFSGDVDISISLTESLNGEVNEKIFENVDRISIAWIDSDIESEATWNVSISNIKFTATWVDGTKVIVSWDTKWDTYKYQINYWTSKDDLWTFEIVTSSKILVENLQRDVTYYFQIMPIDQELHTSWEPSEILEYHTTALSCVVKWIKVRKEQIWDNYYLVRDPVENAISYEVYRSEWADMSDSRLVWNLTGTRFQYLFNPDSKKDEYAYYQVQAICPDWENLVVDKAQKVRVWPVENMLLIIVISIFVYSLYRLNRISDED